MDGTSTMARIRLAAGIVVLEAVALLALGIAELLALDGGRLALGVSNAVFFVLYALGLGYAARGFAGLRGWSRGPVVLAQLIQLGVAWNFFEQDTAWATVVLAVPAIVVLLVVFRPSTTEALYGVTRDDETQES